MEIQYQFFKEKKLLVSKFIGEFSIEHYTDIIINKMIKDASWNTFDKSLVDLRESKLDSIINSIDDLVRFREVNIKKNYLNVFLVDNPLDTALVHLYQDQLIKKNYSYEYCSSITHAIDILKLNISKSEIEKILSQLEYRFRLSYQD